MILNIGLDKLEPQRVLDMMHAQGLIFVEAPGIIQSEPENTFVVSTSPYANVSLLAKALGEGCIAAYDPESGIGDMFGERCDQYGEFDPCKFYLRDGRKLCASDPNS